jgi:hypothetical protein
MFDIIKHVGGTPSTVAGASFSVAAGVKHWIRFRVQGTTLQAKIWLDGTSEPAAWTVTGTDASLGSGACGLRAATTSNTAQSVFSSFLAVAL